MLYARSSCWPPPRYDTRCDSGDSEHHLQMNPTNADPLCRHSRSASQPHYGPASSLTVHARPRPRPALHHRPPRTLPPRARASLTILLLGRCHIVISLISMLHLSCRLSSGLRNCYRGVWFSKPLHPASARTTNVIPCP